MKRILKEKIDVAAGRELADVVFKNGKIIDVFNLEIIEGDVAVKNGSIVGIGEYEGRKVVDLKGKYISPGFIDGHVHIESALVPPSEFAKVVVPRGVTSVVTDPHEIANVLGVKGIEFMINNSEGLPLNVYTMLPSCVPCTPFESGGAVLEAEDFDTLYHHPRVLGLAEVMDYPSVLNTTDSMMDKIVQAKNFGKHIDGHAAGLDALGINVYGTAGIKTDHECTTAEEAKERLRKGLYLMIREGSVAKNMEALLPVVTPTNARRCLFVTDDKHLDELKNEGSMDFVVSLAIKNGLDPLQAIQMVTLNTAECFGLKQKGAIAPGYDADFTVFGDFSFESMEVYQKGDLVATGGQLVAETCSTGHASLGSSINIKDVTKKDLEIKVNNQANIIGIIPHSIVTEHIVGEVPTIDGLFQPCSELDLLKIAVIERHKGLRNIGIGIVKGLGLKSGAIASTVAHDSHNIIVVGTNDDDMLTAILECKKLGGGFVVVKNGEVLATVALAIAGLMSDKPYNEVIMELNNMNHRLLELGIDGKFNPLLTLAFLALPVIPNLKITDKGIFDVRKGAHILVAAD